VPEGQGRDSPDSPNARLATLSAYLFAPATGSERHHREMAAKNKITVFMTIYFFDE
jgi:hypothetical protein